MTDLKVGVVGSLGDLGSQLTVRLKEYGFQVIESDLSLFSTVPLNEQLRDLNILHICAPLSMLRELAPFLDKSITVILHDSVMSSSKHAGVDYLKDSASIVHMLMNSHDTVVLDKDMPDLEYVSRHFKTMKYNVTVMSIKEHDKLMAESQAPLALLVESIHQPLKKYRKQGLLTPSGELLAQTLDARSVAWTPETIHSILRNPELKHLIDDMYSVLPKLMDESSTE